MRTAVVRGAIFGATLCLALVPGAGGAQTAERDPQTAVHECVGLPLIMVESFKKPDWLKEFLSAPDPPAIAAIKQKGAAGDDLAQIVLADMAERGACIPTDPGLARRLYEDVTHSPSRTLRVAARILLGNMMEHGLGGPKTVPGARELYRQAMLDGKFDKDPVGAQTHVVVMLQRRESPLLAEEHEKLRRILADATAAEALSENYGIRTPTNAVLACSVMNAMENPDADTLYRLAWFHLGNAGLSENRRWAWFFLSDATAEGHPEAVRMGVRLLLEGDPFPPQPSLALTWMLQAQERGIAIDERDLAETRSRLPKDEQKLAEENAFIFRPFALPAGLKATAFSKLYKQPFCSISD